MSTTYNCKDCGTAVKGYDAHLRGNAIDNQPEAWCRSCWDLLQRLGGVIDGAAPVSGLTLSERLALRS